MPDLNVSEVHRSSNVALISETEIFCEHTERTKTTWTLLKFEEDPQNLPGNVPYADITKNVFHTVTDASELVLPGKFLPYGFYEIRVRVEMTGLPDVFGTDSIFVRVVPTPLQAIVNDGSFHTVPFGLMVRAISHEQ